MEGPEDELALVMDDEGLEIIRLDVGSCITPTMGSASLHCVVRCRGMR